MGQRSTSRSTSESGGDDVAVGIIRAPHGIRGEVKVESWTDVPERFRKGARLRCDGVGELIVASVRGPSQVPIVRFEGATTREDAAKLRGKTLRVPRAEARRAAKGGYLWADLLGLRAETPDGVSLGTVHEVLRAGETDVLVIRPDHGADVLVPAIASVVREVDLANRRVVVRPQESLE
jgi:16S rRNA processing protein RimM